MEVDMPSTELWIKELSACRASERLTNSIFWETQSVEWFDLKLDAVWKWSIMNILWKMGLNHFVTNVLH